MAAPRSRRPPWDWLHDALAAFERRMLRPEPEYPCHFGALGHKEGHNSFTAVDRRLEEYGTVRLAETVRAYRERAWQGPRRQSLVVFVGPPDPEPSLGEHEATFWSLLRDLSGHDRAPWPGDVPSDPADPGWQWCFDGEPWFVFAASPAYERRRSRDLGPCLTLVLQVRRVFEGLGGSTPAGRAAKSQVRARLRGYDLAPEHPHLGPVDGSSTHKWRQYFLPDGGSEYAPDACPFRPAVAGGPVRAAPPGARPSRQQAGRWRPAGPRFEVAGSLAEVGRGAWRSLHAAAGGSVFYSEAFLGSLERRPLWNGTVPRYLLARDAGGEPAAALPLYWQEDASPFDPGAGETRPRVLLGHDWHCYDTVLLSRVPVDERLAEALWQAVRDLAADLGAARWGLVNTPRDGPLAAALAAAGLAVEEAPARYRLHVGDRPPTLDEHLAGVGRSSRRSLRQYWRRAERAGARITVERGAEAIADPEILALVDATAAKYTPGYYDTDALACLVDALGDACRILRVDLGGRLLATSICLLDAQRMHTWAGGCHYPGELNWSPQYVLFAAELREGFRSGKPVLECGRRNDEFKLRYGLSPYPLAQVVEQR